MNDDTYWADFLRGFVGSDPRRWHGMARGVVWGAIVHAACGELAEQARADDAEDRRRELDRDLELEPGRSGPPWEWR